MAISNRGEMGVGGGSRGGSTGGGRIGKIVSGKKVAKAIKKAKPKSSSSSRQAGDFPVSSQRNRPARRMGKDSARISPDVTIKNAASPSGKVSLGTGGAQVFNQNTRLMLKTGKSEAKANARALKAAQKSPKLSKAAKKRADAARKEVMTRNAVNKMSARQFIKYLEGK